MTSLLPSLDTLYCTVTNALDFQLLGEAFADTDDHAVEDGADGAMHGTGGLAVVRTGADHFCAFLGDGDDGVEGAGQGALGALHGDGIARFHLNFYPSGDGNRRSANS